jgi:hypothetical protein
MRSINLPEVIQRMSKSKANVPAIITRVTMITFASFVRAEDVALPLIGKRFETRLKLLLRWLPTVLITG